MYSVHVSFQLLVSVLFIAVPTNTEISKKFYILGVLNASSFCEKVLWLGDGFYHCIDV